MACVVSQINYIVSTVDPISGELRKSLVSL